MDHFADACDQLLRHWVDDLPERLRELRAWCGPRIRRPARTTTLTVACGVFLPALLLTLLVLSAAGPAKPLSRKGDPPLSPVALLGLPPVRAADVAVASPPPQEAIRESDPSPHRLLLPAPPLRVPSVRLASAPKGTVGEATSDADLAQSLLAVGSPSRLPSGPVPPELKSPVRRLKAKEEPTVSSQNRPAEAVSVKRPGKTGSWKDYWSAAVATSGAPQPTVPPGGSITPIRQVGRLEFAGRQSRALHR